MAVEVVCEGRVLRRAPVSVRRFDVTAHYPDAIGAEQSGFHTWINIVGLSDHEWLVQAVLEDHSRVALARIRAQRLWRENVADGAPLVSVVIPCYNQAHFLGEAIESVIAQSYPNFEIIVVDDGSTDNTSEVVARYLGVRCIRQTNQRQAAARNTGLQQSRGEYLVFLDADDRLLPEALERGLACFEAHPECALVAGHYRRIGINGSVLEEPPRQLVRIEHYTEFLRRNCIAVPATVMYRRSAFEAVGDFDSEVVPCEDYDLYLRIARQLPIYCYEQVVAEYRQHGANVTGNPALMLEAALTVLRRQWPHVKGDASYRKAYIIGWRVWQDYYGEQLVTAIRAQAHLREWKRVMEDFSVLLRHYPRGLISLLFTYSLRGRIREIVRTALPPNASVVVVGSNDSRMLKLDECRVWDLPRTKNGEESDPNSANNDDAIKQLEELRVNGGKFLLFPSTSFWWLKQYKELRLHLESQYRCLWSDERCIIYLLCESRRQTQSPQPGNVQAEAWQREPTHAPEQLKQPIEHGNASL